VKLRATPPPSTDASRFEAASYVYVSAAPSTVRVRRLPTASYV
jgi:hypothetical protein